MNSLDLALARPLAPSILEVDGIPQYRKDGRPMWTIAGGAPEEGETTPAGSVATATPPAPPATPEVRFTAEDIERARKEEKDKVYARIETAEKNFQQVQEELAALRKEREEREAAAAKRRKEAEEKARKQHEEETDAKTLLAEAQKQWQERIDRLEQERELERAAFQKEREFAEMQQYIRDRVAQERDEIAPELLDLVGGNTKEEVESSIVSVKERTQRIAASMQQALQDTRAQMRGVSPTGYAPVGPMDTDPAHQQLSPEDISKMSWAEWAETRQKLGIGSTSQNNRGLFG